MRPSILVDDMVAGTWDLARRDGDATIAVRPIRPLSPAIRDALEEEATRVLRLVAPDAAGRSVSLASAPR